MDKRIERIDRSYTQFLNVVKIKGITGHYSISDEYTVTIQRISYDVFMVYITYENKPPLIEQLQLPSDIHYYIKSERESLWYPIKKKEFDKYFTDIDELRNNKIEQILNGTSEI